MVTRAADSSASPVHRLMRIRLRRRLGRNTLDLLVLFGVVTIGLSLSLTFFVASSSALGGMAGFADSHHRESGHFSVADRDAAPHPGEPGFEVMPAADVSGPGDSLVRVFPPRAELNRHEVVSGRDLTEPDDILLSAKYAEAKGIVIGDRVAVGTGEATVVGFAAAPDYIAVKNSEIVLQPNADEFGLAFVRPEFFDEHYAGSAVAYVAYDDTVEPAAILSAYDPETIRDTGNNSRVQQAIGDSEGPRDLALLIAVIFTVIIFALLAVYHFENRKREADNLRTFDLLGYRRTALWRHQLDPLPPLLAGWAVASLVALLAADAVMAINGKLYDYPEMSVDTGLWAVASAALALLLLTLNWIAYRIFYPGRPQRPVRRARIQLRHLRWIPDIGYRLRVIKALRNPREPLAVTALILLVAFLVSFSLTLRVSVDDYLEGLEDETSYSYMYAAGPEQLRAAESRPEDEPGRLATLYHDSGTAQSVFEIDPQSRYFGPLDGPVVTSAFAEKYGVGRGDDVTLTSIDGSDSYTMAVSAVTDESTSSFVYVPEGWFDEQDAGPPPAVSLLFTEAAHPDLENQAQRVSKDEIVSSGESILEIINIQILLLITLAALLLGMMLFAVYRFVLGTQDDFVRVMKLNGYAPATLLRSLFGFTGVAMLLMVALSYLLALNVVRVFFDGIMFDFSSYVPVTATPAVPVITTFLLAALMTVFLIRAFTRLRRIR